MLTPRVKEFITALPQQMEAHGLTLRSPVISGTATTPTVIIDGEEKVHFASGSYLGLGHHPDAIEKQIEGVRIYGQTSSGARHVCGFQEPHFELEQAIAEYQGEEDAVLFSTVTSVSKSVLAALCNNPWKGVMKQIGVQRPVGEWQIFYDAHSHDSLRVACEGAVGKAQTKSYAHLDMEDLQKNLEDSTAHYRVVATDGVFSADGEIAPLPEIVRLAKEYEAIIVVDDAHGSGVLGPYGEGIWRHFPGINDHVDFKIGSLAKAFAGGGGGFVTCNKEMGEFIRQSGSDAIFGGTISPVSALGITENIRISLKEPWRRETVLSNARYLRKLLTSFGYDVRGHDAIPIVPIVVGESERAIRLTAELLAAGFNVGNFRYPATPKDKARLRLTLMGTHTQAQLDSFVDALAGVFKPDLAVAS